jgi:NAD(P)-dependent dehydrogenase (short-subunit alcohol dehydrogenase family)
VTQFDAVEDMVQAAMAKWGRVDILINNAGVLRDKTFAKMELEDFRFVMDVHLMGSVNCTKAVWEIMKAQNYGRIVFTTSSSGLYGNFGQSNYGAAKMAVVGLMQTLSIEGAKNDIRVNCLAPTAATRMTEDLGARLDLDTLRPGLVTPGVMFLVSDEAPTRAIMNAGAGSFERTYIAYTKGAYIGGGDDAAEEVARRWDEISDRAGEIVPESGAAQGMREVQNAMAAKGAA